MGMSIKPDFALIAAQRLGQVTITVDGEDAMDVVEAVMDRLVGTAATHFMFTTVRAGVNGGLSVEEAITQTVDAIEANPNAQGRKFPQWLRELWIKTSTACFAVLDEEKETLTE